MVVPDNIRAYVRTVYTHIYYGDYTTIGTYALRGGLMCFGENGIVSGSIFGQKVRLLHACVYVIR